MNTFLNFDRKESKLTPKLEVKSKGRLARNCDRMPDWGQSSWSMITSLPTR